MNNRFVVHAVLLLLAVVGMSFTPPVSDACLDRLIPYGIYMVSLAILLFLEVKSPGISEWLSGKFMKAVSKQGEENGN